MKASYIAFPTSVPVLMARGVGYETEFSTEHGWTIRIESPQRVVLSRAANIAENIDAVPEFVVCGFAFAAREIREQESPSRATEPGSGVPAGMRSSGARSRKGQTGPDTGAAKENPVRHRARGATSADEPTPKDRALDGLLK